MPGCVKLCQVLTGCDLSPCQVVTGCDLSGCCLNAVIGQSKANSFTALASKSQIHEITVQRKLFRNELFIVELLDHNC